MLLRKRQRQYMQRGASPWPLSHSAEWTEGLRITVEDMERYLDVYRREGYSEDTVQGYRRKLQRLYDDLPEDKLLREGFLLQWRASLFERGYAVSTVNGSLSVVNTFLDFLGHREYQLSGRISEENAPQPELTRTEYLRLLQTAKLLGKEKAYLLVKLFASTPLPVQELSQVTVEAVREGKVTFRSNRIQSVARLPEYLRKELLSYAGREGRQSGPIFTTKDGSPVNRSYVTAVLRQLCPDAQVSEAKGNPRCLRKLYLNTRATIESNVALLVEQAMDRQLEMEQMAVGWEE